MAGIILSADIGTSSLKAALIDPDGRLRAFSRIAYRDGACASFSGAYVWERAFALALESLHDQAPGTGIDAVSVSGNGPTLIPVTHNGDALPPLYWYDSRTLAPRVLSPAKVSLPPAKMPKAKPEESARSFFLPRAAWLKENIPEQYHKTRYFFSSHEWLAHRLGAEALTALPSAAYEPYYWNDEQCGLFDLDREKFPPFIKMGEMMGRVSNAAASLLGPVCGNLLKSGTPIIAGGPDFITALIGTGTAKPGDVCDRAGSSEGVNVCAEEFRAADIYPALNRVRVLPHATEGLLNVGVLISSSGSLFERYRNYAGLGGVSYETLLAELIPPDFVPPEKLPPDLREPPPENISLTEKKSLGGAVLCAIGFAVRSALLTLADAGFTVKEMRVSGGQAKSPLWNQLKADISGCSLLIPEIPDGELAGNAVLAAAALEGRTVEETAEKMIRFRERFDPQTGAAPLWAERYALYRRQAAGPENQNESV